MRTGEVVPAFELADQHGRLRSLDELVRKGPVVLFFYLAALTPGCTAEACHFRDLVERFGAVGAEPVGISPDPVERLRRFAEVHGIHFPLLSDPDGAVAAALGARRPIGVGPLRTRRMTFVIGTDRRVLGVIRSELRTALHADRALEVLGAAVRR
ncbi:MAG TPA: peroxiredoxin [Acidimicrobiales bacterium]|nr:peroxiredoxin [Acidimicrobiales bacterium]